MRGPTTNPGLGGEACERVMERLMEPDGASRCITSAASCTPVSNAGPGDVILTEGTDWQELWTQQGSITLTFAW